MTLLLALGWPLAGILGLGWWSARRDAAKWQETSDAWETASIAWERTAELSNDATERALKMSDEWRQSALLLNAALYQPLGHRKAGGLS